MGVTAAVDSDVLVVAYAVVEVVAVVSSVSVTVVLAASLVVAVEVADVVVAVVVVVPWSTLGSGPDLKELKSGELGSFSRSPSISSLGSHGIGDPSG